MWTAWVVVLAGLLLSPLALAQTAPTTAPADPLVSLNLPENVPLKVLIDYVSQEFGINFLMYDEQVVNQRVTIKAPAQLPRSAIPALLESALKMRGMALVDAEQPGWKRIVPLAQAAVATTQPATRPAAEAATQPSTGLTQVFKLGYADARNLDPLLKPFLSTPGGSSFPLPEQGLLVVTDYTSNLKRVADLVAAIDRPNEDVTIDFIPVRQGDPARITQQVDQLLKAKARTQGGGDRAAGAVETSYDARTGQVVVIGPRERMADARRIVESLDTAVKAEQSPVRFYKLANTTAAEVLATIRGLEDEGADGGAGTSGASSGRSTRDGTRGRADATGPTLTTPRSRETGAGVTEITPSGGGGLRPMTATGGAGTAGTSSRDPGGRYEGDGAPGVIPLPPRAPGASGPVLPEAATPQLREAIRTRQARITSDPHTNSIIVIAPPDVQRLYEQLIRALDKRRPQVLIEATIVTLDTSDNFQLGVEIGRRGGFDNNGVITFSSFGLSTPDPRTGRLALIPGAGFNGALLSTDIADVVLRALATNTRSRVTSAPRILVNDNNVGTLSSLAEFPYASVNASDTIATTSFGDYVQAGTEIVVSPHISESDYLQLEYSVSLSSFTGAAVSQGGTTLPPPRKSDSVQSQVTIPDGSTIVVGGLNRRNFTQTKDAVPILGQLPVLEYLFSNRTNNDSNTTLFVFIRPVILRDDKFEDLKFLSEREVREAGVPDDFPRSEPLTIR